MSDGLIYDEEKVIRDAESTRGHDAPTNQPMYGGLTPTQTPLPSYQVPSGAVGVQDGFPSPLPATPQQYISPYQQSYVVSPLQGQPAGPQFAPVTAYPPGYPVPHPQYTPGYQNAYGNFQQQPQQLMTLEAFQQLQQQQFQQFQQQQQLQQQHHQEQQQHQQQQQQPPQYSQIFRPTYGASQQQQQQQSTGRVTKTERVYGNVEEKEAVGNQGPSRPQHLQYQSPPDHLGADITNVYFNPVNLGGDDHEHAIKAIRKSSQSVPVLSALIGTYLQKKRDKEYKRLNGIDVSHPSRSHTNDVMMYNHLMDKMEALSGTISTKHHLHKNVDPHIWQEAFNPHRRAIFAELYNSSCNVRGFCAEFSGGVTAFPVLDEWALGTKRPSLNFQRANRQAPNWDVAKELIGQVRTVILLDDSGSMGSPGHSSWGYASESRWDQARNLVAGVAPLVSAHNPHGIDIHFLNHERPFLSLRSEQDVLHTFKSVRPGGGTPTGQRVNDILDGYMCALRYNRKLMPLNLVIVTDGEAQDEEILHYSIEHHVTKIVHRGFQAHQFGVEFLQVGDDQDATRHLEKLEEEVSRHHHAFQRDVVGVTPTTRTTEMTPDKLLGIILSGIDARMNGYMRHRGVNV